LPVKIIFMGTPEFAVPALSALLASEYDLVAVVTQPDRPSGRGKKLSPPPVKLVAERAGVKVLQPRTVTSPDTFAALEALSPDVIIVAAFGQILRQKVLALPPYGCLNVHASLLPRWRGAAPVNAAIQAGDSETGVTIMHMEAGLDTGPTLSKQAIPITSQHTAGSLTAELAELGAKLLRETLPLWLEGRITPEPQNEAQATYAPRLRKEDGLIDWSQSAVEIERGVRAFDPWPGTFTSGPRGPIKVLALKLAGENVVQQGLPGTVFTQPRRVYVSTGAGVVELISVQPAGKNVMSAEALLNGQPELSGYQFDGERAVT
jgi:methionyl-tRNA formyltransferase